MVILIPSNKSLTVALTPASYIVGSSTLSEVDDYSIVTQSGSTKIPDFRKIPTVITYVVEQGDTFASISNSYGISEDTIKLANHTDSLSVGQSLKILPINGYLYKVQMGDTLDSVAEKFKLVESGQSSQSILDWNNIENNMLIAGNEVVIPASKVINDPNTAAALGLFIDTGEWVSPVKDRNYSITQCFTGYHDGLDMASPHKPDILAARAGTVVFSGVEGGWTVVIRHEDGLETVYYHMDSASHLKAGEKVNAGQKIGKMGSTGYSTGIHLHFIIRKGRIPLNPLQFINLRNANDVVKC